MRGPWTSILGLAAIVGFAWNADGADYKHSEEPAALHETVPDSGLPGKTLVQQQCIRCHLEPQPTDLPKEDWPITLHGMGFYLGMRGDEFSDLKMDPKPVEPAWAEYLKTYKVVDAKGKTHFSAPYSAFILPQPIISKAEWLRIREYLESNAQTWDEMYRHRLNQPELRDKAPILKGFVPTVPKLDLEPNGWILSMAVDESRRRLYVGRAVEEIDWQTGKTLAGPDNYDQLLAFDLRSGKRIGRVRADTDPINLEVTPTGVRLSTYGVWPITIGKGRSKITDWEFEGGQARSRMIVNGQQLIIHHHTHDMNGDGLADIVLNAFGAGLFNLHGGQVAVYWQTPEYKKLWANAPPEIPMGHLEGALRKTALIDQVGMIDSAIADFNKDGKPDIAVLVSQASQQVRIFLNNGDETFTLHVVAEHGPAFGGNSLGTGDLDGDGDVDIVVLSGDGGQNGIQPGTPTHPWPTHGVTLLQNNGDMSFTKRFHYPMDGATRSTMADFDGDGDLDIAAVSLFPDWNREEPVTFVYLENKGDWNFTAASLARERFSVWSSITAADVNADGKRDIVLGLGNYPNVVPADWTTRPVMKGRNGKAQSVLFLINNH